MIRTIILLLISFQGHSQLVSFFVRNDTLFSFNPGTTEERQLTKFIPSQGGQSGKVLSTNGTIYNWLDPVTALNLKANLASPTFTGTVAGISATMVGLGNVTNESKATMFTNSTFTGTHVIPATTGTSLAVTGAITSSGAGIGYTSGNGGTVTQITNKSTGVTLNKLAGDITMVNSALAAAAIVSFTLTNNQIAATDIIHVQHNATGTFGAYTINGRSAAGSAVISIRNNTAGALAEAIVIKFIVIKAATN